jgi:hypothetical protein
MASTVPPRTPQLIRSKPVVFSDQEFVSRGIIPRGSFQGLATPGQVDQVRPLIRPVPILSTAQPYTRQATYGLFREDVTQ